MKQIGTGFLRTAGCVLFFVLVISVIVWIPFLLGQDDVQQALMPNPTTHPATTSTPLASLSKTKEATLWVHLFTGDYGWLEVYASPAWDVDSFDLTILVEGLAYCNPERIYADDAPLKMGCEGEKRNHQNVEHVSAQSNKGDLYCERNESSTDYESIFACRFR